MDANAIDCTPASTPIFNTDLVWLGVPILILLALVNSYALKRSESHGTGWPLYTIHALFLLQIAGLRQRAARRV